jgi:hypothetical protein
MCTVCGRQFHRSDYLKLHSYSHTEERPFNCHVCGKGFKMNYNLKLHLKNHENQQPNLRNDNLFFNSLNSNTNYINNNNSDMNNLTTINLINSSVSNEMVFK